MKYLPILLFIAALNIAIKKCSSPEAEVKNNERSSDYKKYILFRIYFAISFFVYIQCNCVSYQH